MTESPKLYTMAQAVILGRRAICDSEGESHRIEVAFSQRLVNANGTIAYQQYGCTRCDVRVELSYPELDTAQNG